MSRLDRDGKEMEKPNSIWKAKGGKGFTGYQSRDSSLKRMKSPGSVSTCPSSPFVDTGHGSGEGGQLDQDPGDFISFRDELLG